MSGTPDTPMMTLGEAHALLPQATRLGDPALPLMRVHTDTRTLQPGDLFVALAGERFDAHDFLPQAAAAGAVAAVASRGLAEAGLPGLQVADTRQALSALSARWRAQFELPLVAVTGSNGKTTVTQMVASILRAWMAQGPGAEAALSTQGNFNNDIGVPLTLLRLRRGLHRCAVVELGMNHPGEIEQLAALAAPTVALVNNAQREHQEFMHTVEAVAFENGAVLQALPADGVAVFPADDAAHTPIWQQLAGKRRLLRFGQGGEVDAQARWVQQSDRGPHWCLQLHTPVGQADVHLAMAGPHNVRNAMAAAAAALGAGVPLAVVVQGLEAFQPVKGRSALRTLLVGGRTHNVVDDSYNANPDSVRAAIDMLAALPGPHWLVLGDMGEVGTQGPAFHEEVGAHAARCGLAHFWTAGELCQHAAQAYGPGARHFASAAALVAALEHDAGARPEVASVLVKGSRFMKMETLVAHLDALADASAAQASSAPTTGGAHAA